MNKDKKNDLEKIGEVKPELVQIQIEKYCKHKKIIISNSQMISK